MMIASLLRPATVIAISLPALLAAGTSVAKPSPGCFVSPAKLSDDAIGAFVANPASLLSENPTGGLGLVSRTRSLVGSSGDALEAVLSLIPDMAASQKTAVGAGLARAAKSCQASAPDYSLSIQQRVAAVDDAVLTAAFKAALDDIRTTFLGMGSPSVGGISGGGLLSGATGAGTRFEQIGTVQTEDPSGRMTSKFSLSTSGNRSVSPSE